MEPFVLTLSTNYAGKQVPKWLRDGFVRMRTSMVPGSAADPGPADSDELVELHVAWNEKVCGRSSPPVVGPGRPLGALACPQDPLMRSPNMQLLKALITRMIGVFAKSIVKWVACTHDLACLHA